MSTLKKSVLLSFLWSILGQFGAMGVNLISNIIIARILTPHEFGQIGIVMFFITIAAVLTESGLAGALIRQKEVSKDDLSTVFIFNLLVSILCFLILLALGGWISSYYKDDLLRPLLYVSGILLFINALNITQNVQLIRAMDFKRKSIYNFIGVVVGAISGISFALNGYGVWSLIYMQLISAGINTLLLIVNGGLFFSFNFNKESFKNLYIFGVNTTLALLLDTAFDNVYQLIFGRFFSISQAGLYYQAKKTQDVPTNIINLSTQNVIFSLLSKLQDDKGNFSITYNKIITLFTIAIGTVTPFIFMYSDLIVKLLYGGKWLGASLFMKFLCIASFFYLQEMFNRVIFKVFNKTRQILYLEIVKKSLQSISIIIGILMHDVNVLLFGFVITSLFSYVTNFYFSRKILGNVVWHELLLVGKVIIAIVLSLGCFYFIKNSFKIEGYYLFILYPFFLILYVLFVKTLKIANVLKELKSILILIK